jgi:hypothetical protein
MSTHTMFAFQNAAWQWIHAAFGKDDATPKVRGHRFVEESIELAQSAGVTREDVLMLVDYVYSRPVGEPTQEVGGVALTLAGLCCALNINMSEASLMELGRVWLNIDKIRAKNATKKADSALPGYVPPPEPPAAAESPYPVEGVAPLTCDSCGNLAHMGACPLGAGR